MRQSDEASAYTQSLRPVIGLDPLLAAQARRLRRRHPELDAAEIAARLGEDVTEGAVLLALATLRTRRPMPRRATLNVPPAVAAFVRTEAREGEVMGRTVDRLLAELRTLRRQVAETRGHAWTG
jgi:hypothetical protein